ncbi:SusC/RagA family TonB-linked outer membrane protein [Pedobacter immunditicola]|uniref:SusC/RagA family TonB-linked outer membrane protein n=1 Tax=Pedobacter immunditicola TaxID=3133440 RepID=UPI003095764C
MRVFSFNAAVPKAWQSSGAWRRITVSLCFIIPLNNLVNAKNQLTGIKVDTATYQRTSFSPFLQEVIRGKVSDAKGGSLPGVSVTVKNTNTGTLTKNDGTFQLRHEGKGITLVVSYIGYLTKEVTAVDGFDNIVLEEDIQGLSEVVVVGYGTTKKINLTGAITQVSAKDLQDRPVSNLTQALQGVVPNLNITFGSGKPGQSGSLNVRGNTSINGGAPLVLIDGVPGDIDRVNTFDVESISVLKDASASAVYGARAAFGVILVTTKQARDGKTTISYSNNFGSKSQLTNTDFITSGYWNAKINDDAMYNALGNTNTRYSEEDYAELLARVDDQTEHPDRPWVVVKKNANGQDMYRYYANFDWYNYLFSKHRPTNEHNISLSGSSDKVQYLISANTAAEQGVWKINPDNYNRYNMRGKINVDVNKWLKVSNNTRFFKSKYNWSGLEENFPTVSNNVTPNYLYHFMAAYVPKNPDGTLTGYTGINSYSVGYGMHAVMENGKSKGENAENEFTTTFEATVTPFKGLNITGNYTYGQENYNNYYRAVRVQYSKFPGVLENYAIGGLNKDQLAESIRNNQYQVYNIFANYETQLNNHHFKVMAGFNQEERTFKTLSGTGSELLSETLNDLNLATGVPVIGGGASDWALRGAFYRFNYAYDGKYLFEASGRYDGTSRFGKNDRFGFFPSLSAGWVISQEEFFKPLTSIANSLKFRYSYGTLGNQDVATYAYISSMGTGQINYLIDGQKLKVINNPAPVSSSLTWERSITNNFGIDATFIANRLSLSADIYSRKTEDMLTLGKTLPEVFGASEPKENAADLKTNGFELSLNWKDKFMLGGKPFGYSFGGVLADYTSKITKFDNPSQLLSSYYVGQQLGEIWGYSYDGFFKTNEEAQAYAAIVNQDRINNRRVQAPTADLKKLQAGDIKILDLDGNGIISTGANTLTDPGDRRIIGNTQPRYTYGFNFTGAWNNFDIAAFFQGVGKRNWYPNLESQQFWHVYARPYGSFLPEDFADKMWSPENQDAYFPLVRGYIAQNSELSVSNDMYLQDIAYLRLKNLTLGYSLPKSVLSKIKVRNLRIYISAENVHTWSKMDTDYLDPEEVLTDPTGRTYPMAKTYSAGIQLTL